MKKNYLICLMFSIFSFGQTNYDIEKNKNLIYYKKVKIFDYIDVKHKSIWSKIITLKEGKIFNIKTFNRNNLTSSVDYFYDNYDNISFEIIRYEIGEGKTNDTLKYSYIYNKKGQLVKRISPYLQKFSNFNFKNMPQTIEADTTKFDSIFGFREELKYDENNNIIEKKTYSKINNTISVSINIFKYNDNNDVIEINRSKTPEIEYPAIIIGGRSQYKIEKFRYVYNTDGLWIEKYWIINNKEYLIQKRKFKKK